MSSTVRYKAIVFFAGCVLLGCLLAGCGTSKQAYNPTRKFGRTELQADYTLLRNILEVKHPALYWYTPKDSMDYYFNLYYQAIGDSMTEQQFGWKVLAPLTNKVHCGHTSFGMSKAYNNWAFNKRFPSFPLFIRLWGDTMMVTANLNRKDSIFKRGTVLTHINGLSTKQLLQTLIGSMTMDGYADNVNYMRLGNNFPYYHRNIIGLSRQYEVTYLDSAGNTKKATIPLFEPQVDTTKKAAIQPQPKKQSKRERRKQRLLEKRSLVIDTLTNTAIVTLNTFSGGKLRSFMRRSFREIRQRGINDLVIDLRINGGGKVSMSTLLTKYISKKTFKIADTAVVAARSLRPYTKYIKSGFFTNIPLGLFSRRRSDGLRHFGYLERRVYKPKKRNHFDGSTYVLINGATFSASTLFAHAVKGQPGVTLVGEEAGGGAYGNTGILIPDITLPHTKMKVRLPLVRLVQYNPPAQKGRGVWPDVYVPPSYAAFMKGKDKKMEVVFELIKAQLKAVE